jgi:hypothetical protein
MAESNKTPACNARMGAMPGDPNECRTHALECTNLAETALNKKTQETFLYFATAWFKLASQIENSEALVNKWGGQSRLTQLIQQQRSGQPASLSANDELGKLRLLAPSAGGRISAYRISARALSASAAAGKVWSLTPPEKVEKHSSRGNHSR